MQPSLPLVDSDETLAELTERLGRAGVIAVDTEFHGEKRYRPQLFLIQFADDRDEPVAVDPLAVSSLMPLSSVFSDESIVKVFHSARNDIAILRRELDCEVRNVFDTQVAAAFLGYGEQVSLSKLAGTLCGNSSHSSFSLSDWSIRPLSEEQLSYALDDVRYLLQMHEALRDELEERGRTSWFRSEVSALSDPLTYDGSSEPVFRKTRSAGKVRRNSLPVLWALVKWREGRAEELDRPRNGILRDGQLCRIAAMSPTSVSNLRRLRGLPSGFIGKWGEEIAQVVSDAREHPPDDVPDIPGKDPGKVSSARQDVLRIFLKQKSETMRISSALLLPRKTARSLLSTPPATLDELMAMNGIAEWRKEALGEELVDLLNGRIALALGSDPSKGIEFIRIE